MEKIPTNIHPIQTHILRVLLFQPSARFTDLNPGVLSDHFTFHVNRLVELGVIIKNNEGWYELTTQGKEFANRFDTDSQEMVMERQPKVSVIVGCVRGVGKQTEYLIQQRLKHPFFGYHGFITGKIKWGETIAQTAARELQEETQLSAEFTLVGVKHKQDFDTDQKLLEDKFFFVMKGSEVTGQLQVEYVGGKNQWIKKSAILKLPQLFDRVDETMDMLDSEKLRFSEFTSAGLKY